MLRTALRPRWLALLAAVLLAATGMALLGQWQLERARDGRRASTDQAEQAREQTTPRPVGQVLPPRRTFPRDAVGVRVEAVGEWQPDHRLLVTGRARDGQDGRDGYWVLVPLRLADGSAVPVVRGWVATPSDPAAAGPDRAGVRVVGLLQPSEPSAVRDPGTGTGLPADQLDRVAVAELVNRWPWPLTTGFVVQQSESPATAPVPEPVPPPRADPGLDLQNLSYAVQWWVFAGLGLFLWWRLVRDDHRERTVPDDVSTLVPEPGEPGDVPADGPGERSRQP